MFRFKLNYKILNNYCIFLLITVFTILGNQFAFGQSYQVTCNTINTDGSIVIEIWNPKSGNSYRAEAARKDAVYAIIFKGTVSNVNCSAVSPLLDTQQKVKKFKDIESNFFGKKGDWNQFAHLDAANMTGENIKDRGKTYKITIAKESLRSYLIENKIIDSLMKGF